MLSSTCLSFLKKALDSHLKERGNLGSRLDNASQLKLRLDLVYQVSNFSIILGGNSPAVSLGTLAAWQPHLFQSCKRLSTKELRRGLAKNDTANELAKHETLARLALQDPGLLRSYVGLAQTPESC